MYFSIAKHNIIAHNHRSQTFTDHSTLEIVFYLMMEIKKTEDKPWVFFTAEQSSPLDQLLPKHYIHGKFRSSGSIINKILRKHTLKSHKRKGRNHYIGFSGNGARDDIYKALSGVLKAQYHYMENDSNSEYDGEESLLSYYEPIVLLKGDLFEAFIDENDEISLNRKDYIQTYFNYTSPYYKVKNRNVVHVITEEYLEEFINQMDQSLENIFTDMIENNIR